MQRVTIGLDLGSNDKRDLKVQFKEMELSYQETIRQSKLVLHPQLFSQILDMRSSHNVAIRTICINLLTKIDEHCFDFSARYKTALKVDTAVKSHSANLCLFVYNC
jgi:hypothetical protein